MEPNRVMLPMKMEKHDVTASAQATIIGGSGIDEFRPNEFIVIASSVSRAFRVASPSNAETRAKPSSHLLSCIRIDWGYQNANSNAFAAPAWHEQWA